MQEAVDVAVQLKKIKEQVKKEVSKIIPKIEKLVTDQLESEVLVRSSKEANTSHAVAANLSELELKKILIDKMEANNSINRDGADDDQEPSAGTDRGSKRRRSGKEPASTSAPSETTTKTAGKTTGTGSQTHKKSASQSAPVEEAMQSTDVFKGPADQEFETGVQDEQAEEEVQHLPDWFQKPTRLPSPDHAWNKSVPAVHETVQPWLSNLAQQDPRESFDELTDSTFDFSAFGIHLKIKRQEKKNSFVANIDELHKFSDGTLDDVRSALNDRLKGIRMEYLPETFWNHRDKANARAMIQAIDKRLKTRGMRSWKDLSVGRPLRGYKAVRLRFSDPMIQPEPEGSTQGYPLVSVDVLSHGPSDAMHNPSSYQSQKDFVSKTHGENSFSVDFRIRVNPHGFEGYVKWWWRFLIPAGSQDP
ncbi:hypothetical protein Tco_0012989 [Tanacetum coccineum]